jgi:hypothetical protein
MFKIIGTVAIVAGVMIALPTLSRTRDPSDAIMLLGTPIAMNGITLCLYGGILIALGRVVGLLEQVSNKLVRSDIREGVSQSITEDEKKIIVSCPKADCGQQIRVPAGKSGLIKCPKCESTFSVEG